MKMLVMKTASGNDLVRSSTSTWKKKTLIILRQLYFTEFVMNVFLKIGLIWLNTPLF